jgi:hypothetical protein
MKAQTFQEYLDARSKLQNTGKEQEIADYVGPKNASPSKEKKHKDAGGHGQKGNPAPYAGTTTAKDPNKGKNTDGFAAKGDKKLEYNPHKGNKKNTGKAGVPGGKEVGSSWPKTKTQEWIDSTKELPLSEFAKQLKTLDECACENGSVSLEAVRQTAMLAKNEHVLNNLIREMKRQNNFDKFVIEMFKHQETFKVLANLMENDEGYARSLVRAMNEMVAPPMHDELEDEESEEDAPMGMEDGEETDMGGEEDLGGEELGSEEDLDSHDPMDGLGDDMPKDDMNMDMPKPPMRKKKKKLHAHDHLMNAMKDSPMAGGGDMSGMNGMGLGM